MKNPGKFAIELSFTVVVAFLLSLVVTVAFTFIAGNLGSATEWMTTINAVSSTVFGLVVGFKLNDLLRQHKK